VAPSVEGQRGTAVLPIDTNRANHISFDYNDGNRSKGDNKNKQEKFTSSPSFTTSYQPWSNLCHPIDNSVLSCYDKDSRIVVNNELNAASDVYAAGSVARYPDNSTGQSAVAGEGVVNGYKAGEIAAHNMYRTAFENVEQKSISPSRTYAAESMPFWRTDVCPYVPLPEVPNTSGSPSHGKYPYKSSYTLASMGIHAFCIGRCDSNDMATHGFWWTNQASDARRARSSTTGDISRRSTSASAASKRPVYGSGVLFYLDRDGIIRGIMTWGLPFTRTINDEEEILKSELVERMKDVLHTNGRVATVEHNSRISDSVIAELDKLSSLHLAEESKYLASLAYDGTVDMDTMSKPLHRYVPSKPANVIGMGILKRRNSTGNSIGGGILEEDFFARRDDFAEMYDNIGVAESERPQSLIHVYPMSQLSPSDRDDFFGVDTSSFEQQKARELQSNFRSRPPKEEPLWLRRGDVERYKSMSDSMADAFIQNMRKGKLADGSDAFKHAPTPQVVQNAKELVRQWTSSEVDDKDDDGEIINWDDHTEKDNNSQGDSK